MPGICCIYDGTSDNFAPEGRRRELFGISAMNCISDLISRVNIHRLSEKLSCKKIIKYQSEEYDGRFAITLKTCAGIFVIKGTEHSHPFATSRCSGPLPDRGPIYAPDTPLSSIPPLLSPLPRPLSVPAGGALTSSRRVAGKGKHRCGGQSGAASSRLNAAPRGLAPGRGGRSILHTWSMAIARRRSRRWWPRSHLGSCRGAGSGGQGVKGDGVRAKSVLKDEGRCAVSGVVCTIFLW